jgi:hypothetical protein
MYVMKHTKFVCLVFSILVLGLLVLSDDVLAISIVPKIKETIEIDKYIVVPSSTPTPTSALKKILPKITIRPLGEVSPTPTTGEVLGTTVAPSSTLSPTQAVTIAPTAMEITDAPEEQSNAVTPTLTVQTKNNGGGSNSLAIWFLAVTVALLALIVAIQSKTKTNDDGDREERNR